ncbi:copper chaperone [Corynebacterium sp. sy017]|nr:copper chaperone [Corynebacterium sp. sy017]QDZ43640.1 heavy-metal-associated domain-containing protein [Corynebacterium sp. sy039]TSD92064.1 copper chaperone [Corynebacterium sp. SY003]
MTTKDYYVSGMSCQHCVHAITEELNQLADVHSVTVDLESGQVRVVGTQLNDQDIIAAIDEAGYALADTVE